MVRNRQKGQPPNKFWLKLIPISILVIAVIAGFIYFSHRHFPIPEVVESTRRDKSLFSEVEVKRVAGEIKSRLSSVELAESSLIFKDKSNPRLQYLLTIKPKQGDNKTASVYLFDRYKYIIATGNDQEKTPTMEVCRLIDAIYDRKDPILEALKEAKLSGKVSLPLWKFTVDLEAGNVTPILVEILYSLRKFIEVKKYAG